MPIQAIEHNVNYSLLLAQTPIMPIMLLSLGLCGWVWMSVACEYEITNYLHLILI